MNRDILGIHHITAIAGEPQQNLDFYAGVLGLRLVKLTVNYDDPATYHLYYGDGVGHPGTILTFFPWPGARQGRHGNGQLTVTSFAIAPGAVDYWMGRLAAHRIAFREPFERFGERVISFPDPDGLSIELVSSERINRERAYKQGAVPVEYALHGFHSAALSEEGYQQTAALLTATFGFKLLHQEGNRFRYGLDSQEPGSMIDVVCTPDGPAGRVAVGTVHHIAWRTPNDEQQRAWLAELTRLDYNVTPIIDRKYFHSIYFREPGQVLFEIATDPPGFAVDEDPETLGAKLVLPAWLEPSREELRQILPPLRLPVSQADAFK